MMDDQTIPDEFICPLTLEVMREPVIDRQGVSYERDEIMRWLQKGNHTSPSTGKPLVVEDLRPNLALKSAIESKFPNLQGRMTVSGSVSTDVYAVNMDGNRPQSNTPTECDRTHSQHLTVNTSYDGDNVMVTIRPPVSTSLARSSICCVVDVSGSMGCEATIQNESGAKEGFGLSVLDVTKHALNTIIRSLSPEDRFSLVTFSSESEVVCQPMNMTPVNAEVALKHVAALQEDSLTNLWAGLANGLDVMRADAKNATNPAIFLLTDGLPNQSPGKGEVNALKSYLKKCSSPPCRIYTFGFGYDMDSPMLNELSILGGGAYGFIPDSSFVGTVFVNAVSNHLATAATDLQVSIGAGKKVTFRDGDYKLYQGEFSESLIQIYFGSIQFGQTKNIVVPLNAKNDPYLEVKLLYNVGKQKFTSECKCEFIEDRGNTDIMYHLNRLSFVAAIDQAMLKSGVEFINGNLKCRDTNKGSDVIRSFAKKISKHAADDRTQDLLKDLSGQVTEAFSKNEYVVKWGVHYCLSIKGAHLQQCCNNFKDPGVQHYGGDLFGETRDRLDDVFVRLPAPKPSIKKVDYTTGVQMAAPSMSRFMNSVGPCFHASGVVSLPDRKLTRVDRIQKGDKVLTGKGVYDTVQCVLKTIYDEDENVEFACLNGDFLLTPWHPVNVTGNKWEFPAETGTCKVLQPKAVYSFLLENRGTVVIHDVECATLAHGLSGDVIGHDYLGTEAVVRDLEKLIGWRDGLIEISPDWVKRAGSDNMIVAITNC